MFAFPLVQTIYWIALAVWFGSVLFVALAVPVVFQTVREADPTLPRVLSVNLDTQHASLLAGDIAAGLLRRLSAIQLTCAAVTLLMLLAQLLVINLSDRYAKFQALIRAACFVAAVGLLIYDRWFVWPRAWEARRQYLDDADNPDVANPALDRMERYGRESELLLRGVAVALSLLIACSGTISPRLAVIAQ
jgi:hypothetical protein